MKKWLVAAVICALPCAASAEMTGKNLRAYCRHHPQQTDETSLCTGYIWGSLDAARALKVACEPAGVTGTRLVDITIKYLLAHPEQLHLPATTLIIDMYKKEFPCPRNPR